MKTRQSVRKTLHKLIQWVDFANGRAKRPPDGDDYQDAKAPEGCEETRRNARSMLEFFADYQRMLSEMPVVEMDAKTFDVGSAPRRLVVSPAHAMLTHVRDALDYLMPAINQKFGPVMLVHQEEAWHRLRLCKCGKLFVALNVRAEYCTRECSNRLRQQAFYVLNRDTEKERKLARYHVNRLRTLAVQQHRAARKAAER
jgi:hypothetical protein